MSSNAISAISAVLSSARNSDIEFQEGPASTLLTFTPRDRRRYPAATAMAEIRQQGLILIGHRDLRDGRVAIEFGKADRRDGLASLCHQNVALGLDVLAAQGWRVSTPAYA